MNPILALALVLGLGPSEQARSALEALVAADGPGFPAGAHVAVTTPSPELGWALRPQLESLGASFVSLAEDADQAVRLGAEWHLVVEPSPDRLEVRVFEVDRGLWRPAPPRLVASASVERPFAASAPTTPVRPAPAPPPRRTEPPPGRFRLGRPVTLLRWEAPIWALASCPRSGGDEVLLLLEPSQLVVVELDGPRPRTLGRLDLSTEAPAERPIRAPFGLLRCGPPGQVGLGHGHLESGLVIAFDGAPRIVERLAGWPVGHEAEGWWLARPDEGRRRFEPLLRTPQQAWLRLETPLLEISVAAGRIYGVDERSDLRPLTRTGALGLPVTRAGAGLTAQVWDERTAVVTTSAQLGAEQVTLRFGAEVAEQALAAPTRVTALGRPRGRQPAVLVVTRRGEGRAVLSLPVEGIP